MACTRAKKKLLMFGSASTLEGNQLFQILLNLVKENKWILDLPPMAHQLSTIDQIPFENTNTSSTTSFPRDSTSPRSYVQQQPRLSSSYPITKDILNSL